MAKQWTSNEAPQLVENIYKQVLERSSDSSGSQYYAAKLSSGGMSVREVVKTLALSHEHTERFITPNVDQDGVKLCYKHLLARDPETEGLNYWTTLAQTGTAGWPAVVNGLVDSEEYTRRFGDDNVPA